MKTRAIIQARMGSTRLPGKVMRLLCGATVLAHVVRRVQACRLVDEVVVATSNLPGDDIVAEEAQRAGVSVVRDSEEDVLARVYEAARGADVIVRVTADCPLFDPKILEQMLERFYVLQSGRRVDYLSNTLIRTFPVGLDAEVMTIEALERAHREATDPYEREHVTPYIYRHPERFVLEPFVGDPDLSAHRWTLDTEEDYTFLRQVFEALCEAEYPFGLKQVLALLKARPHLARYEGRPDAARGSGSGVG